VDEFLTATKVGERTEVEGWGWAVDVASRVEEKVDFNFFFTASSSVLRRVRKRGLPPI